MPTLSAYKNGLTMGSAGKNLTPPKRGKVTGWTAGAVRRHTRWLYSVEAPSLDGWGYAVTLTLKDTPASAVAFHAMRRAWIKRLGRRGLVRLHWVIEWQKRGTPHLHTAVYFDHELSPVERWLLIWDWLQVAAAARPQASAQYVLPIDGPVGWLRYLSKHAGRGVKHYQRAGKPAGWETTGRLWGYWASWPTVEPLMASLTPAEGFRFRRLVRAWRVADARAAGLRGEGWRRLTYARHMLRCPEPRLSRVRGVSEWIPEDVAVRLLGVVQR